MPGNSELERFLRQQSAEGKRDSEGSFSIARDQALQKLAGFQLPFEGAWALKIVQAAVASGEAQEIRVTLDRTEQRFEMPGLHSWTLEAIEEALFSPDKKGERSIDHLVIGLRGVGLSDLRGFLLGLPDQLEALAWDGENMKRLPLQRPVPHPTLSITCKAKFEDGGFFGLSSLKTASQRNAAVTRVLATRAYTCPIPLSVDKRRLDALELDPIHGWGESSQLLAVGFEDGPLPELRLSPGVGQGSPPANIPVEGVVQQATADYRKRTPERAGCRVAVLLSLHLERVKSGKTYTWEERDSLSHCSWVTDGVVVQIEAANTGATLCSVGWFVAGEGLETDLTSLYLRESGEKKRRYHTSLTLVSQALQKLVTSDFSKISQISQKNARTGGTISLVLGAGLVFLSPMHGLFFLGMGALTFWSSGDAGKDREDSLYRGVERLNREFERLARKRASQS